MMSTTPSTIWFDIHILYTYIEILEFTLFSYNRLVLSGYWLLISGCRYHWTKGTINDDFFLFFFSFHEMCFWFVFSLVLIRVDCFFQIFIFFVITKNCKCFFLSPFVCHGFYVPCLPCLHPLNPSLNACSFFVFALFCLVLFLFCLKCKSLTSPTYI